jgi:hypothetical protein
MNGYLERGLQLRIALATTQFQEFDVARTWIMAYVSIAINYWS